jgi:hypothetical protein
MAHLQKELLVCMPDDTSRISRVHVCSTFGFSHLVCCKYYAVMNGPRQLTTD